MCWLFCVRQKTGVFHPALGPFAPKAGLKAPVWSLRHTQPINNVMHIFPLPPFGFLLKYQMQKNESFAIFQIVSLKKSRAELTKHSLLFYNNEHSPIQSTGCMASDHRLEYFNLSCSSMADMCQRPGSEIFRSEVWVLPSSTDMFMFISQHDAKLENLLSVNQLLCPQFTMEIYTYTK